jgi:hypothetical protein
LEDLSRGISRSTLLVDVVEVAERRVDALVEKRFGFVVPF